MISEYESLLCTALSGKSYSEIRRVVIAIRRDAVVRGVSVRDSVLGDSVAEPISTMYLGGGTPSQLTTAQLEQLFLYINKVYGNQAEEVTIEANPDDVTPEFAATLSRLGINRVSMGAQTFDDARLRFLHRRHTAAQVPIAVQRLRDAGIHNISVDLMYGFPNETLADWQHDIEAALALNVEHISAYCLMIEEGTVLYQWSMVNSQWSMDEELERQMYELLIERLTDLQLRTPRSSFSSQQ